MVRLVNGIKLENVEAYVIVDTFKQTREVVPMLSQCWAIVIDSGPGLAQHVVFAGLILSIIKQLNQHWVNLINNIFTGCRPIILEFQELWNNTLNCCLYHLYVFRSPIHVFEQLCMVAAEIICGCQ